MYMQAEVAKRIVYEQTAMPQIHFYNSATRMQNKMDTYQTEGHTLIKYVANAQYSFSPDFETKVTFGLLKPDRSTLPVVGNSDNMMHYVVEAFEKTTEEQFPQNIAISVLSEEEFSKEHARFGGGGEGVLGFSVNNNPETNIVCVKANSFDIVMLTIGHEIGHVMTTQLPDPRDEEAKAFAFELAWMKTLKEHNIADLQNQFVTFIEPARNGLHNVAFDFVINTIEAGKTALQTFKELFNRTISVSR